MTKEKAISYLGMAVPIMALTVERFAEFDEAIRMAAQALVAEPKTGKWVTVHGFCTPGGDPVWACSECGKGIHVYGIEHNSYGRDISDGQWKACPNCGCRMEGEEYD